MFDTPTGFKAYKSGNTIYLRDYGNSTQIYLVVTDTLYTSPGDLWPLMDTYCTRTTAYIPEEEKEVECMMLGSDEKEEIFSEDRAIIREKGSLWYHETGGKGYKIPEYAYYTLLNCFTTNDGYEPSKGVILWGVSQTKTEEELYGLFDDILISLTPYTTQPEDMESIEFARYVSDKADCVEFDYPKDWVIEKNRDGMIIITAPDDWNSVYSGMIIEYYADENKEYVEDYAQFSAAYEPKFIIPAFTQTVNEKDFGYTPTITYMDINAKIKEKPVYYYEVSDVIHPTSKGADNSFRYDAKELRQKRYAFKALNTNCAINFILPNEYCDDLAEQIIASMDIP